MNTDTRIQEIILDTADRAQRRWSEKQADEDKPRIDDPDILFAALLEELSELRFAMLGLHEDAPALELIQIGGIVHNMIRILPPFELENAHIKEKERHP